MANVEYNSWYNWLSADDYLVTPWQYIDWKNVTWLNEWYWITLWPKPQKQILTNWAIRGFIERSSDLGLSWAVWEWEIYLLSWTDLTPEHTLTDANFSLTGAFLLGSHYYFIWKFDVSSDSQVKIAQITTTDANSWNWVTMNEAWETWLSTWEITPFVKASSFAYLGDGSWVFRVDKTAVKTTFSFTDDDVVWITVHWTQFKVYSVTWKIYYWDWLSASYSSLQDLWNRIERVAQQWNFDYIITQSWDLWKSSWYDYVRIWKHRKSKRLNDNSQFIDQLNFNNELSDSITVTTSSNDVYMISWSKLYKYWSMIDWLQPSFHSVLETDSAWNAIDEIFCLFNHERSWKLAYSYRSWTTYWIDFIDLESKETAKDWHVVTPIFRWPPNKVGKIREIRATTSNTSWSNYIKLYKRINNWSWELFRTINNSTDTIDRLAHTSENDQFTDVQFKIEFHNESQWDTPPVLHHFELIYEIIKE